MKIIRYFFLLLISFTLTAVAKGQIKLPRLIADGMVLQRDSKITLWGWASPGEKITVAFAGKKRTTTTTAEKEWRIDFPAMPAGGPYTMKLSGKNDIMLTDILIGDVWLCSGQSNMVHQMSNHDVTYAADIAAANNPAIRQFWIPGQPNLAGRSADLAGGTWQRAVGEEVRPFSAVAYFFARKTYERYHVPIGLINASIGGSPIEAWIGESAFTGFDDILKMIGENKDEAFVRTHSRTNANMNLASHESGDEGLNGAKPWYDTSFTPERWRTIFIPGYWEDQGAKDLNGVVWYRKQIELPESMERSVATVYLGRIVDADKLYINNVEIGGTTYQYPQRRYTVPAGILKAGKNVFVIRVVNTNGKGGFVPDKPYYIFNSTDTVSLTGTWRYKVGEVYPPSPGNVRNGDRTINPQNEPTALYNGMIAPIRNYALKGVLWYQGESNIRNGDQYFDLMKAMIGGWRKQFENPSLPFIYAQLPNFGDVTYSPIESSWATLRASELMVLQIPHTAMTVNIDLGEWNDIHPDNKKDVGERMAVAAAKLVYGEDVVASGPIYDGHTVEGNKVIISFSNIGGGLVVRHGHELNEFAIAASDRKFVWAKAKIEGDKVIVWSDKVSEPVYVRYGWADNPDNPNLYNKEGLPASPFETR